MKTKWISILLALFVPSFVAAQSTRILCETPTANTFATVKCDANGRPLASQTTKTVCVSPTVTAAAYSTGNDVGGVLTFASMFNTTTKSGTIANVRVFDAAGNGVTYDFIPVKSTLTTAVTDKTAVTVADADLITGLIGPAISVSTSIAFADNGYGFAKDPTAWVSGSASLLGLLIVRGAPTYAAATDVTVCVSVWQD